MIPHPAPACQTGDWRKALSQAIRDPAELLDLLALSRELLPAAQRAAALFPLRVPRGYVARMETGNPADPLLRQVLPLGEELLTTDNYSHDPVGDQASMPIPGLLHKYHGRVLLITTAACGVHCRYCFRRHFPYCEAKAATNDWHAALDYIAKDNSINEVILSGGDPLSLSDNRLASLVTQLEAIPHIKRLRLHTRQVIILPERVDSALLSWLADCQLPMVIVVHTNHANEIDTEVAIALQRLASINNIILLNQAVLLRGVNDEVAALMALSERLFENRVLPYYLHQLDRVQGAQHFEVSDGQAVNLMNQLRNRLPGFLVPRLVRERTGAASKIPIESYTEL
ncbi:MAG: EF-P beta-lysylation protein EpmB [Thiohalomonadales bacterium]|nr:EF-P beta-lysylation protein EpmB [Thiohalomonadales bacterium]